MHIFIDKIAGGQSRLYIEDYITGTLYLTKVDNSTVRLTFNGDIDADFDNSVDWTLTTPNITGLSNEENVAPKIILDDPNGVRINTYAAQNIYMYETTIPVADKTVLNITVKSLDGSNNIFVATPYAEVDKIQLIDNDNGTYTFKTTSDDSSTTETIFTPPAIEGYKFSGISFTSNTTIPSLIKIGYTEDFTIDTDEVFYLSYEVLTTTYVYRIYDFAGNNILAQINTNYLIVNAILTVDGSNKILVLTDTQGNQYTKSWSSNRLEYDFKGLSIYPNYSNPTIEINKNISIQNDWFTFYEVWELKSVYTVDVNTANGDEILASKGDVKGTVKISLEIVDNFRTLNLYDKDGNITTLKWDLINPDKIFIGLALSPNATTPFIYVNDTKDVDFTSVSFYEVYTDNIVPDPSDEEFKLLLYKNSAEPRRVDKTNYLRYIGTLTGTIKNVTSILSIDIDIEYTTVPNFNYVYIPSFKRYYYVTNITTVSKNIWNLELNVDLLMSYKDGIKSLNAFIDRNEYDYNDNIIDKKRVIEQGYDVDIIPIENELFIGESSIVVNTFNTTIETVPPQD